MTIIRDICQSPEALSLILTACLTACGGGGSEEVQAAQAVQPLTMNFIGNSLTYHPVIPGTDWDHASGMAASDWSKDYAHVAAADLGLGLVVQNFADLERQGAEYTASIPARTAGIDGHTIVVVELSDNATTGDPAWPTAYSALLDAVSARHSLYCLTTWWRDATKDAMITAACTAHGGLVVSIGDVRIDPANRDHTEGRQYTDSGINGHPHDWSMAVIGHRLAATVKAKERL